MKQRERLIWGTITIALTALSLYLAQQLRATDIAAKGNEQSAMDLLSGQAESSAQSVAQRTEIDTLKKQIETLRQQLQQAEARPIMAIPDVFLSELKSQGLKDPVSDILDDLQRRTDLLPFQGALGGQARFSPWLINRHWVVAGVGDGHRGGWAILKYQVENGNISWTLLETAQE